MTVLAYNHESTNIEQVDTGRTGRYWLAMCLTKNECERLHVMLSANLKKNIIEKCSWITDKLGILKLL